jgi:Ca-activated chloride channel family protein
VVVAHRYVNRERSPIEAVYVFPLEEGAASVGSRRSWRDPGCGRGHERDEAFELYDDVIEADMGRSCSTKERPDIFQASVGNLPPGSDVIVKLTYVAELAVDDGRLRFAVPTTVSPRYAPAEDQVGVGRPDSVALNPPTALSVPYGLNLSVRAVMPHGITSIESPSHPDCHDDGRAGGDDHPGATGRPARSRLHPVDRCAWTRITAGPGRSGRRRNGSRGRGIRPRVCSHFGAR